MRDGVGVGIAREGERAGESRDEHEQRGFGQVEVREQRAGVAEFVARPHEEARRAAETSVAVVPQTDARVERLVS